VTRPSKIVLVQDEPDLAANLARVLGQAGRNVVIETDTSEAAKIVAAEMPDVVIADLCAAGPGGLDLLRDLRGRHVDLPVIVVTRFGSTSLAAEAMRSGAADYLAKPFPPEELVLRVERAVASSQLAEQTRVLRERVDVADEPSELVGQSSQIRDLVARVNQLARSDTPVLVVGEPGTGKQVVARTIHRLSARAQAPYRSVDCSNLDEGSLECRLFGSEGAESPRLRPGLLAEARGGTVLLDEISEASSEFQAKLRRAVREGEFRPVGGERPTRLDVRLVLSTSCEPQDSLPGGRLLEGLLHELGVARIDLPPLRGRAEDIPLLAAHFVRTSSRRIKKRVSGVEPGAMNALARYQWPGNVRELQNVLERAVITAEPGEALGLAALPAELRAPG